MPIPGKTFQTSYILATNKTVKQQKITNAEIYPVLMWHTERWIYAQNVHREPWHK